MRFSTKDIEIYDLCFEIRAEKGWKYDRIAEHLFKERGISHPEDAGKPVHRSTIMRWIRLGQKRLTKEKAYRHDLEGVLAMRELDYYKELLLDLVQGGQIRTAEDTFKLIDIGLKLRRERSSTAGIYPERRKDAGAGDVEQLRPLDPETDRVLYGLERLVNEEKLRNAGNGRLPS